jgi:hypothetical protein
MSALLRGVGVATATLIVALGIGVLLREGDVLPADRADFLTMIQALSPIRKASEACLLKGHPAECGPATLQSLQAISSQKYTYFLLQDGVLVGVSFKNHVMLVMTPSVSADDVAWSCAGWPASALHGTSCIPLMK